MDGIWLSYVMNLYVMNLYVMNRYAQSADIFILARLFVNGAAQPSLIVNDLKHGEDGGDIGLWIGPGTQAYFDKVTVENR